jgi:UDP-3-O-[3-hydroxymyristoyl] glucosamine N-acyltransferase
MAVAVRELAHLCNAEILGGNPEELIHGAANTKDAQPHELTFIAGSKYLGMLATTAASAVLVPAGTLRNGIPAATSLLRVDDPEMAFITCLTRLYPGKPSQPAVSPQAAVEPSATIGPGTRVNAHASIGAHARIGKDCLIHAGCRIGEGATIGDRCVLHPNTVLYDEVVLGDDVIVHAGSVIGADGFGYKLREGRHVKFPQVGTVVIGSQVEIGANTCIDRAALGATRIGDGTKIDNQVHIAHNVQVGQHVLMCGQVGIGGSTKIGDYVVLAAQCGVADHVEVGEQSIVFAQAGVTKCIKAGDQVMGYPATSRREYLRETAALRKIAAQYKDVEDLIQLLPQLKNMISDDGAA